MRSDRALAVAAIAFAAFCAAALIMAWTSGAFLGSAAGVWLALAIDLRQGIFYRPLVDYAALGGTRYFPLQFILQAVLMRAGASPVAAGRLVSALACVGLVWAAWRLLEEALDVPRPLAWPLAILALCTSAGVFALTTIRGDVLAAMLNLWGVVCSVRLFQRQRSSFLIAAIALFALAIFAKISAAYAPAAMTIALALNRQPRRAVLLGLGTLAGVAAIFVIANAASDGRMWDTMRACLFGGGQSSAILRAPLGTLFVLIRQDPLCTLLLVYFGVSLALVPAAEWKAPITCLALACLAMTTVLFASPGVDVNHLLDFFVVATLFVGGQLARGRLTPNLAAPSLAVAAVLTMFAAYLDLRHSMLDGEMSQVPAVRALVRQQRDGPKPLFTETGVIPSLEGERSYLLDNWMYEMLRGTDPRFDAALGDRLRERYFGAVVLMTDPASHMIAQLYGDAFLATLTANYEQVGRFPPYTVYRPKGTGGHGSQP